MNLLKQHNVPRHVAIIMDGNGRWAQRQGEARVFGHHSGATRVREVVETAGEMGVNFSLSTHLAKRTGEGPMMR